MICFSSHDVSGLFKSLGIEVVPTDQKTINIEIRKVYKTETLILIDDSFIIDEDIISFINNNAYPLLIKIPYNGVSELDIKSLASKSLGIKL